MSEQANPGFGDFLIWLLLSLVTFGIYAAWWQFSRTESVYRKVVKPGQD